VQHVGLGGSEMNWKCIRIDAIEDNTAPLQRVNDPRRYPQGQKYLAPAAATIEAGSGLVIATKFRLLHPDSPIQIDARVARHVRAITSA
jgi:hypothetical protein